MTAGLSLVIYETFSTFEIQVPIQSLWLLDYDIIKQTFRITIVDQSSLYLSWWYELVWGLWFWDDRTKIRKLQVQAPSIRGITEKKAEFCR